MPELLGGVALLVALLFAAHVFVNADPQRLARYMRWFLVGLGATAGIVIVVLLIASERLGTVVALVGFLAPVLLRGKVWWRRWQAASGPRAGKVSEVETEYLRMRLDHDTGAMSGTVRRGRFAGQRLEGLAEAALIELWRECVAGDDASARLMESYLDRFDADWRAKAAGGAGGGGARGPAGDSMTREEAYAVLGLAPGADPEAIKDAYHKLMMKLHPDQGGSTYLAAKLNRAREVLLGHK